MTVLPTLKIFLKSQFYKSILERSVQSNVPTLGETGWVVIDICQRDVHGGGPRQASHLATHVLGLNHHLVLFSVLSIHVEQRCLDDTYGCEIEIQKWKGRHERYFMESFIYANKCRLSPTICKPLCRCHCDIKMIICSLPSEGNYSHTGGEALIKKPVIQRE